MQTKTLVKLLIVLLLLVGAWQGWNYWQQKQLNQVSGWVTLSTDANADQVNKIVVDGSLQLMKQDQQWMVDGTLAKVDLVDNFLGLLKDPQVELVSQSQDRYTELGVDDEHAKKLSFWQGDEQKLTVLVSDNNAALIREQGKQNVYKLNQSLTMNTSPTYWVASTPTPELSPTPTEEKK